MSLRSGRHLLTALVLVGALNFPAGAQHGQDPVPPASTAPSSGANPTEQAVTEQQLLQEMRKLEGRITIPDYKAALLEQPQGRSYQFFHERLLPWLMGGLIVAMSVYLIFDFAVIVLLFAMIFKFLPDAEIQWRDVWIGAVLTAVLFGIGKWLLGLYLGSGAAGSAYGPASSLITLLLWVYYSSQILLFGAEFTQVYANRAGREVKPDEYAVRVETKEVEKR